MAFSDAVSARNYVKAADIYGFTTAKRAGL
jgi:hypothetical protein